MALVGATVAGCAMLGLLMPEAARAQISLDVSVTTAPPELPVYTQPPIPADGYLWTPGYWAWSEDFDDYYWVPGTWVLAPQPGYLWTPGYWGYQGSAFLWHPGYWGTQIGFYGGVNYGYGYGGNGYEGGYWRDNHLYYNSTVNNIRNTNITTVYQKTVINNVTVNRVSYNGGDGTRARPTPAELSAAHESHLAATPAQRQQVKTAQSDPSLRASANRGHPPIAATQRPGEFKGAGVVAAREAAAPHAAPEHSMKPTEAPRAQSAPHATEERPAEVRRAAPAPHPAEPRAPEPRAPEPRAPEPRAAEPQREPAPHAAAAPSHPNPPHAASRPEEHPHHDH
jgi:hypothetical protein